MFFLGGRVGGERSGWEVRVDVNGEVVFVKSKKKLGGGGRIGGGGRVGGVRMDVNEELKFL